MQDPLDSEVRRLPVHRARASHICFRKIQKANELRVETSAKRTRFSMRS